MVNDRLMQAGIVPMRGTSPRFRQSMMPKSVRGFRTTSCS